MTLAKETGPGSLWIVKEANGMKPCKHGSPILCGEEVRLENIEGQGKNLHSHHTFQSPLSRQQEVSLFGENGEGDEADNWVVACTGREWKRDAIVKLQHVETRKFLGATRHVTFDTSNCGHMCPILGHMEVCGMRGFEPDKRTEFKAVSGIYIKDE